MCVHTQQVTRTGKYVNIENGTPALDGNGYDEGGEYEEKVVQGKAAVYRRPQIFRSPLHWRLHIGCAGSAVV
jgi:hypothetical protein